MSRGAAKIKIQKLLNLAARPGTPGEGEVAREMAEKLAKKHGFKIVTRRAASVRQATTDATAKARTEQRRVASMRLTAYDTGWDVGKAGFARQSHYTRRVVFGVNIQREWLRGYDDAKKGEYLP